MTWLQPMEIFWFFWVLLSTPRETKLCYSNSGYCLEVPCELICFGYFERTLCLFHILKTKLKYNERGREREREQKKHKVSTSRMTKLFR